MSADMDTPGKSFLFLGYEVCCGQDIKGYGCSFLFAWVFKINFTTGFGKIKVVSPIFVIYIAGE